MARDALIYMERYVDEGAKTYSPLASYTEADPTYRPNSATPCIEVPMVEVPRDQVQIFSADPDPTLAAFYMSGDNVSFAVHPQIWEDLNVERMSELRALPRAPGLLAMPTASTRTVFVSMTTPGVPPHFLKLHFPRRISRFSRRLRFKTIANSVAVTRDLGTIAGGDFAFLPDVVGVVLGNTESAWGFLVREHVPRPRLSGGILVPCFALFAGDVNRPDDPPLVVQLIERARVNPESFLLDSIMIPLVRGWAKAACERGILMESHAQNTLLELEEDFRPRRIVHRDCDVLIDPRRRHSLGLEFPFLGRGIGGWREPIPHYYSLVYDRFIGHEFFDYLMRAVARHFPINVKAVKASIADEFHAAFPHAAECFPSKTTYYFSPTPAQENEFALQDTGCRPEWR